MLTDSRTQCCLCRRCHRYCCIRSGCHNRQATMWLGHSSAALSQQHSSRSNSAGGLQGARDSGPQAQDCKGEQCKCSRCGHDADVPTCIEQMRTTFLRRAGITRDVFGRRRKLLCIVCRLDNPVGRSLCGKRGSAPAQPMTSMKSEDATPRKIPGVPCKTHSMCSKKRTGLQGERRAGLGGGSPLARHPAEDSRPVGAQSGEARGA